MPKKAIFETPSGEYYAVPAAEAKAAQRLLARSYRVHKLDWDEFQYDGPARAEVFTLREATIHGVPAHMRGLTKRRLTAWYLVSLTVVSYVISEYHLPSYMDAGLIVVATLITMWLREQDWI